MPEFLHEYFNVYVTWDAQESNLPQTVITGLYRSA